MNSRDASAPVAVITGGGTGLGLATGLELRARGLRVIALGLDAEPELEGSGIGFQRLDITDEAALARAGAGFERVEVLVNAAGIIAHGGAEFCIGGFRKVLEVNLNGTHLACLLLRPALARAGGSIVNFASMWSYFGSARNPRYSASKGAIVALTRALAVAFAADGIRVNAVAPGWIRTRMSQTAFDDPARSGQIAGRIPAGCWGEPVDIAKAAAFLASGDARYITGVTLPVDGGFSAAGRARAWHERRPAVRRRSYRSRRRRYPSARRTAARRRSYRSRKRRCSSERGPETCGAHPRTCATHPRLRWHRAIALRGDRGSASFVRRSANPPACDRHQLPRHLPPAAACCRCRRCPQRLAWKVRAGPWRWARPSPGDRGFPGQAQAEFHRALGSAGPRPQGFCSCAGMHGSLRWPLSFHFHIVREHAGGAQTVRMYGKRRRQSARVIQEWNQMGRYRGHRNRQSFL